MWKVFTPKLFHFSPLKIFTRPKHILCEKIFGVNFFTPKLFQIFYPKKIMSNVHSKNIFHIKVFIYRSGSAPVPFRSGPVQVWFRPGSVSVRFWSGPIPVRSRAGSTLLPSRPVPVYPHSGPVGLAGGRAGCCDASRRMGKTQWPLVR